MEGSTKTCECGREIRHVRTLTGPMIRNGSYEVWTHTDTGYAPCNVDANGRETVKVFIAIEFNFNTVGGFFRTREACQKFCDHAGSVEPNLWFQVKEFDEDLGLSDDKIRTLYSEWKNS